MNGLTRMGIAVILSAICIFVQINVSEIQTNRFDAQLRPARFLISTDIFSNFYSDYFWNCLTVQIWKKWKFHRKRKKQKFELWMLHNQASNMLEISLVFIILSEKLVSRALWLRIPTVELKIPRKLFLKPNPELLLLSSYSFRP